MQRLFKLIVIVCLSIAAIALLVFGATILSVEGPKGFVTIVTFLRDLSPIPSEVPSPAHAMLGLFMVALICALPVTVVYFLWMINKRLKKLEVLDTIANKPAP
jgi:hypothetical protein